MFPSKPDTKNWLSRLVVPSLSFLIAIVCSQPCHAQSGGDAFSSQGVLPGDYWKDYWKEPGYKGLDCDPFDPEWEDNRHSDINQPETLEPTGDPFMDTCLFGGNHNWYRRTFCEVPVFDDGAPWWQDYLDKSDRFGCCDYKDPSGKPLSKPRAIALLLKKTPVSRTRPLRYTLRALWQIENDGREPSRRDVDEAMYQRLRGLYLSASQQSTFPIMRIYYRARAFACCDDESDQLQAAIRTLRSLSSSQAAFQDVSADVARRQKFDESRAVTESVISSSSKP